ncbi:glycosyltransferase family 2 protein [Neobacillus terrae]|uniref:glycosyltransferase family 2 protein n=1 Tax=Neobacillus terrae TaxID=3034837 RepID=UPI00140D7C1F|nr:glycosyltransferase family A protein [Neobacillus terrae]NHM31116.1 glycosyltransferase [Neobacillus terrae]
MDGVSIITCTIRRRQLENIFNNYNRQICENKELIIILNKANMSLNRWKRIARKHNNVFVYKLPDLTLGACLNFGIEKAKHPNIAKFDDDDYYSPKYLTQALDALANTEASVVGKMSVSTYFQGRELLAIRKPNNENCYLQGVGINAPHLGGGTLVWKKSLYPDVGFPNKNLGEDVFFQVNCEQKGYKIYSTDSNYYVSIRQRDKRKHTWKSSDKRVLKESEVVAYTDDFIPYIGGVEE